MEMPQFNERKKIQFSGKYTEIIVDKAKQMNKRDQKKVCKEKKTDIKHIILINGNVNKLPSLKTE